MSAGAPPRIIRFCTESNVRFFKHMFHKWFFGFSDMARQFGIAVRIQTKIFHQSNTRYFLAAKPCHRSGSMLSTVAMNPRFGVGNSMMICKSWVCDDLLTYARN